MLGRYKNSKCICSTASKYMQQKLTELKEEINQSIIMPRDFNSVTDATSRQNNSTEKT